MLYQSIKTLIGKIIACREYILLLVVAFIGALFIPNKGSDTNQSHLYVMFWFLFIAVVLLWRKLNKQEVRFDDLGDQFAQLEHHNKQVIKMLREQSESNSDFLIEQKKFFDSLFVDKKSGKN